jgi:hypothetical protein
VCYISGWALMELRHPRLLMDWLKEFRRNESYEYDCGWVVD